MVFRLFLSVLLAAGLASAQRGGGGGSKGGGGMGGDVGMRPQRQTRLDMIADKLKLTKEQKDEASKIFDNGQEKAAPLNAQILNGRNQITAMLVAGTSSGADWDNLMKAYTGVLAQQEAIEAEAYQKLYASLEDKQKKNAPAVFEELMADMFTGRDWRRPPASANRGGGNMGGMGGGMGDDMGGGGGRGGR